jgi:hypothetical protein
MKIIQRQEQAENNIRNTARKAGTATPLQGLIGLKQVKRVGIK